jgi:ABC-type glutathione transport system ATPase component
MHASSNPAVSRPSSTGVVCVRVNAGVLKYLNSPEDPWPKNALAKKKQRDLEKAATKNYEKLRGAKFGKMSRAAGLVALGSGKADGSVSVVSIVNTDRKRKFGLGLSEDDQPIITALESGGLGKNCGLCTGDRLLAINGHRLHNGKAQVARILHRSTGRFEFNIRRSWAASQIGTAEDAAENMWNDSRAVAAITRGGQRVGLLLAWDKDVEAVVIKTVIASSPFYATVRQGDELLAINGIPIELPQTQNETQKSAAIKKMVADTSKRLLDATGKLVLSVRTPGLVRLDGGGLDDDEEATEADRRRKSRAGEVSREMVERRSSMQESIEKTEAARRVESEKALLKRSASAVLTFKPYAKAAFAATPASRRTREAVRISNVSFNYGNRLVLNDIDLEIPIGAKMVIYGRSGCGKSTLLKIIARLYQPKEGGSVSIFEEPLNDVCVPDVMTFMEQRNVMFEGSVAENLKMGLGDEVESDKASENSMRDACLAAYAWSDIQANATGTKTTGLEFDVGFRGKRLNMGLVQRLCLARCVMRRKPLLLMDEPLSSQDQITVNQVTEQLKHLTCQLGDDNDAPLTSIMISHQTEVAKHCTHAAILVNGRIVESGEIPTLIKRKGHLYRRLASSSGLSVDEKGRASITNDRLRQIWLFANAPLVSLSSLATKFRTRTCRMGETLYEQGEEAATMFIVVSGQVEELSNEKGEQPSAVEQQEGANADAGADGEDEGDDDEGGADADEAQDDFKRLVYQHGDAFGISALIDATCASPPLPSRRRVHLWSVPESSTSPQLARWPPSHLL